MGIFYAFLLIQLSYKASCAEYRSFGLNISIFEMQVLAPTDILSQSFAIFKIVKLIIINDQISISLNESYL